MKILPQRPEFNKHVMILITCLFVIAMIILYKIVIIERPLTFTEYIVIGLLGIIGIIANLKIKPKDYRKL